MKTSGYSGIGDLVADLKTNRSIIDVITEKNRSKKPNTSNQFSVFENETGKQM